jgi:hypothetical protein
LLPDPPRAPSLVCCRVIIIAVCKLVDRFGELLLSIKMLARKQQAAEEAWEVLLGSLRVFSTHRSAISPLLAPFKLLSHRDRDIPIKYDFHIF